MNIKQKLTNSQAKKFKGHKKSFSSCYIQAKLFKCTDNDVKGVYFFDNHLDKGNKNTLRNHTKALLNNLPIHHTEPGLCMPETAFFWNKETKTLGKVNIIWKAGIIREEKNQILKNDVHHLNDKAVVPIEWYEHKLLTRINRYFNNMLHQYFEENRNIEYAGINRAIYAMMFEELGGYYSAKDIEYFAKTMNHKVFIIFNICKKQWFYGENKTFGSKQGGVAKKIRIDAKAPPRRLYSIVCFYLRKMGYKLHHKCKFQTLEFLIRRHWPFLLEKMRVRTNQIRVDLHKLGKEIAAILATEGFFKLAQLNKKKLQDFALLIKTTINSKFLLKNLRYNDDIAFAELRRSSLFF